jgi:predicted DNA-binding transcriptional regulator AlpA
MGGRMDKDNARLRDDSLVDMKFITAESGLTVQYFYKLIREGAFPQPIKFGRMSRWLYKDYSQWKDSKIKLRDTFSPQVHS